ncbi:MAG: ATP-binding cassette domain-containing protein [Nocardiopsaceae bacterium]|jgi:ABC-2 type transport system ATP-binding protein|nr:ATP-binding cassette domain-containing protein [Nocardiopsaceae bacterium]
MTSSNYAIEARGLVKNFRGTVALDGVELMVGTGTVYGLLGPNGAGKTTAVRILSTLLVPDGGTAMVLGHDVIAEADEVRRRVALAGQAATVDNDLTGSENLRLIGRLAGLSRKAARTRAGELLGGFGLEEAAGKQVKAYSGGMRRRLDLAASMIVRADLYFLDEPTTGLDPASRAQVHALVRSMAAEGATVLLTTQYLEEADQLAARIAVIDHGQVVAEGPPARLKAAIGAGTLQIRLTDPGQRLDAERIASRLLGATLRSGADPAVLTTTVLSDERAAVAGVAGNRAGAAGDRAAAAVAALTAAGIAVQDFSFGQPSLDEVFLTLTGQANTLDDTAMEAAR